MQYRIPLLVAVLFAFALAHCSRAPNVHDDPDTKARPCIQCHTGAYEGALTPDHRSLPQTCEKCHVTKAWSPSTFQHPWPLENEHAKTPCASCHSGNPPLYRGIPTVCSGCHQKDADHADEPVHTGLPSTCSDCHTTANWKPSTFAHPWPLDGAHAKTECASCHAGSPPRYPGTPDTCDACHHADYQKSTYPGHATFPTTCGNCHDTRAFRPALPPGHPEASFPLTTGKHSAAGITCLTCHKLDNGAATKGQNTDCVHCHLNAHLRPAIDSVAGHAGNAAYPKGDAPVNFCLSCHPSGQL